MKKTFSIGVFLSVLLLFSCNEKKSDTEFEINGTIADYASQSVYLDQVGPMGATFLDSTRTDAEGKFSLLHPADSNQLFSIRLANNQSLIFLTLPTNSSIN